jgi:hypothetical protein
VRNNITFERLFKLWTSVWGLVLEEKRHLETVTALLQRIVFEERGYPHFKNWPEICKLGETQRFMMLAVATVDLSILDEKTHQLIAAFPQCFGPEEIAGPYPLSLIRADAEKAGLREKYKEGAGSPISYRVVPSYIPLQGFDKTGNSEAGFEGPILPKDIDSDTPQGGLVTWEGKQWVVLENNESCQELWIAPAECIRVDI